MYELLFEDAEGAKEDVLALDAMTNTVDGILAKIASALDVAEAGVAGAASAAESAQAGAPCHSESRPKPNEALKPFQLTKDHSPVELASWIQKFKANYSSSLFAKCLIAKQQAYFRNVIDVNLEARIAERILPDTPVLSERANMISCIAILEEEFAFKYPLFAWRVALFNQEQKEGQLMSDFEADVRANADRVQGRKGGKREILSSCQSQGIFFFRLVQGFVKIMKTFSLCQSCWASL